MQMSSLHPGLVCNLHIILIIMVIIITMIITIIIIIYLSSLGESLFTYFGPALALCLSLSVQAITKDL